MGERSAPASPGGGPRLSLIISTFERPATLALALEAARVASVGVAVELVVADDGSGPATREVVESFAARAPFPVLHVRQDHLGFRLARIRNRAVSVSRGEVLVFLDGDCLLFPGALSLHSSRVRPGRAHTGARVFLEPEATEPLLSGGARMDGLFGAAARGARWSLRRLFLKNLIYRGLGLKPRPKLTAANCAVHRADFERINGFDERFEGWGYEDDDLARRLRRAGGSVADGTLDCLALHLFHPVHPSHRPTSRATANYRYFHRGRFLTRCRRGLLAEPLESLRYQVLGRPGPALEPLLAELGAAHLAAENGSRFPPQVTLVCGGASPFVRARGELVVRVPAGLADQGAAALRAFLEETV